MATQHRWLDGLTEIRHGQYADPKSGLLVWVDFGSERYTGSFAVSYKTEDPIGLVRVSFLSRGTPVFRSQLERFDSGEARQAAQAFTLAADIADAYNALKGDE